MPPLIEDELRRKLCARAEAVARAAALRRPLVFTNGVFDLLHRGHVACLTWARRQGASLVVGVNSDISVARLGKGPERPLNHETDRACVIAALEAVSLVVVFDESTPLALIEALRPEVYVKGGDYRVEALAEGRLVARWGGRALAAPYVAGQSTTRLVGRIRGGATPPQLEAAIAPDGATRAPAAPASQEHAQ